MRRLGNVKDTQEARKRYVKPELRRIKLETRDGILACREPTGGDQSPYGTDMCALSICLSESAG
jgi:hypothetical protein